MTKHDDERNERPVDDRDLEDVSGGGIGEIASNVRGPKHNVTDRPQLDR